MADGGKVIIKIDGDDSGFRKTTESLGKVGKAALKGIAVGGAAVTAAIVGIGKSAISAYADYEQLAGGVETLFKDSSATVRKYANEAYKTAGLSANRYMETVTSFSASLLQSLKGDTKKAAAYADMAVTDMSDNANKMGTDMSLLQNAYQGFAKENYTMLDNLKLGYGGTKTEMQRLVSDAAKLDKSINANSLSFGNVVKAIHAVQTEMGITGTTAKEAATTIQGSLAMTKSAWENLMTGLTDPSQDLDKLIDNVFNSLMILGENLMPRIEQVLGGISTLIVALAPPLTEAISNLIPQLLPTITEGLATLMNTIIEELPDIVNTISTAAPLFVDAVFSIINTLVGNAPDFAENLFHMIERLVTAIVTELPEELPVIIEGIGNLLITAINSIEYSGMGATIVANIAASLINAIPALMEAIIGIFDTIMENAKPNSEQADEISQAFKDAFSKIDLSAVAERIAVDFLDCMLAIIQSKLPKFAQQWISDLRGDLDNRREQLKETGRNAGENINEGLSATSSQSGKIGLQNGNNFSNSVLSSIQSNSGAVSSAASNLALGAQQSFDTLIQKSKQTGENAGQDLADGMGSKEGDVSNASSSLGNASITPVQESAEKTYSLGEDFGQGYANGINSKTETVRSAAANLGVVASSALQDAQKSGSPSKITKGLGKDFGDGYVLGIESKVPQTSKAAVKLAKISINAVAEEIENIGKNVKNIISDLTKDTRTEVQKVIDELNEPLLESERKYNEESERLKDSKEESDKKYLESLKQTADEERKIYDALIRDMKNYREALTDYFSQTADGAISAIQKIIDKQKALAGSLKNYSSLTGEITEKNFFGDEITKKGLTDFKERASRIELLGARLQTLQNRGINKDLYEDILGSSVEEMFLTTNLLINLSDADFKQYNQDYAEYLKTTERLGKQAYQNEAEKLTESVMTEFSKTPEEFFQLGEDSSKQFGEGFLEELKNVMQTVTAEINAALSGMFTGSAQLALTGAGGNTYSSTYYIQPSYGESTHDQLKAIEAQETLKRMRGGY